MSLSISPPTDPIAGKKVKVVVSGFTSTPTDADVAIEIDQQDTRSFTSTYESSTGKLCIEIPTSVGDQDVYVAVSDPGNTCVDRQTILL